MPLRDHSHSPIADRHPWESLHAQWPAMIVVDLNVLEVGKPLPTLPLWLEPDMAMPLGLESSYEETSQVLRIA